MSDRTAFLKSTLCGVGSQVTTPTTPPNNISFVLQAQPLTPLEHTYLVNQVQGDATCKYCGLSRGTMHHLLFEYRKWRPQRNKLHRDLETYGYETHRCRRISTRRTFRGAQRDQGSATIPSLHQCSFTPGASMANVEEGPRRR